MSQQDEVRRQQLEEETEKRRVLEDALHVLAQEHHALEKSVHIKARQHGVSSAIALIFCPYCHFCRLEAAPINLHEKEIDSLFIERSVC